MQLRKVQVKGIQSLADVTVDLSSGLTALIGRSESGKTAFIRAILLVFTNSDSKVRVRKGVSQCEVTLWFDNGLKIVWRRKQGRSTGTTSYLVPGKPFTKMGRNVPEEVAKIAFPWIVAGKNFGFVQIQEQNPEPFLTTDASAKSGRAWDHLEGKVYREALDACKSCIRNQVQVQSTCLKKLNFHKDYVSEETAKLDSLYISSQKCIREINVLYSLLLYRKLQYMKESLSALELLHKGYAYVLLKKLDLSSILMSDGLLEEVLEFQQAYFYDLFKKVEVSFSVLVGVKTLSQLLKVYEVKNSVGRVTDSLVVLLGKLKVYDRKLVSDLDCAFYKKTGVCVLLQNMLG